MNMQILPAAVRRESSCVAGDRNPHSRRSCTPGTKSAPAPRPTHRRGSADNHRPPGWRAPLVQVRSGGLRRDRGVSHRLSMHAAPAWRSPCSACSRHTSCAPPGASHWACRTCPATHRDAGKVGSQLLKAHARLRREPLGVHPHGRALVLRHPTGFGARSPGGMQAPGESRSGCARQLGGPAVRGTQNRSAERLAPTSSAPGFIVIASA